jgi:hypothetical protein
VSESVELATEKWAIRLQILDPRSTTVVAASGEMTDRNEWEAIIHHKLERRRQIDVSIG